MEYKNRQMMFEWALFYKISGLMRKFIQVVKLPLARNKRGFSLAPCHHKTI